MSNVYITGANGKTRVVAPDHNTGDIIELVLCEDGKYLDQTKSFTSGLAGKPVPAQCQAIWQALRDNVKYVADTPMKQNLKSPARLFKDGVGDCKSFSLFEASCLRNLGIPYCYRFVSFRKSKTPTHVYIVAMPGTAQQIIMDGVLPQFNYQKPYTYKYDVNMPLSMLTGVDNAPTYIGANIFQKAAAGLKKDANKLASSMKTNAANAAAYAKDPKKLAADAGKAVNAAVKDAVDLVQTINPANILVRTGVILAMQNNLMNAAGKLKLGYLTQAQAQAKKYNISEWQKLQKQLNTFIKTYTTVFGGKADELKAAILKGGGQLNGIGCPSMSYIGAQETDVQKFLAAALPIIMALVKDFIGINFGAMTASSANGMDEQQANKSPTLTTQQMNDIAAGATALAGAAQASGLLPGGASSTSHAPATPGTSSKRAPAKSSSSQIPLLIGGAAALFLLTRSKKRAA